MPKSHEVETFYLVVTLIILILLLSVFTFFILFRRRQNILIVNNLLEEEKYQKSLLVKELENQTNLTKERERISEDIHDDIGGILSAIKLEAEFIKDRTTDENIVKSLDSIAENTITATHNFRELIWCLHSQNDNLAEFNQYIATYTKSLFEHSSIKMKISLPILHEDIKMNSHLRRQLLLVIKECLNNIIKHSRAFFAELSMSFENKLLIVIISDNGIGHQLIYKKGHGLHNIEKRVKIIGGTLEIKSTLENGTIVTLQIPL